MLTVGGGYIVSPALVILGTFRRRRPANDGFFAMACARTRQHNRGYDDCERVSHWGIIALVAVRRQVGGSRQCGISHSGGEQSFRSHELATQCPESITPVFGFRSTHLITQKDGGSIVYGRLFLNDNVTI